LVRLAGRVPFIFTTDSVSDFAAVVAGQAATHPAADTTKGFFLACHGTELTYIKLRQTCLWVIRGFPTT
jgi:hypothetical protein